MPLDLVFPHSRYEDKDGEKVPVAASWLDVSVTRYANPCGDLVYFLYSSTTPQLRRTHLDHLLGHYHDALVRCLGQLGQDPGTYPYRWATPSSPKTVVAN